MPADSSIEGPLTLLVMGVSGSGKSTIARLLAQRLGGEYLDADDFHPPVNVEKMRAGTPLTDADRWPWLQRLNQELRQREKEGQIVAIACSALKASYRDCLLGGLACRAIIALDGSRELLSRRMSDRQDHFMPTSLLDSQLATLECPEDALTVSIEGTPDTIVTQVLEGLPAHLKH